MSGDTTKPARRTAWPCCGSPHVLVADDNDDLRDLLIAMLRDLDCHVLAAKDGAECLALLALLDLWQFDLLVLDLCMPHCSGLDVVSAVRTAGSDAPAIVVTAFGNRIDHYSTPALGITVLRKPIDMLALQNELILHLRRPAS